MAGAQGQREPLGWRRVRMFAKDPRQAWIEAEIAELRLEVERAGELPR